MPRLPQRTRPAHSRCRRNPGGGGVRGIRKHPGGSCARRRKLRDAAGVPVEQARTRQPCLLRLGHLKRRTASREHLFNASSIIRLWNLLIRGLLFIPPNALRHLRLARACGVADAAVPAGTPTHGTHPHGTRRSHALHIRAVRPTCSALPSPSGTHHALPYTVPALLDARGRWFRHAIARRTGLGAGSC
jgi:hypothetical protein